MQKANSYCACVRQTEECWLPKIVLSYDFTCYFIHVWIGVQWEDTECLLVFIFREDDGHDGHGGLGKFGGWKEDVLGKFPPLPGLPLQRGEEG